MCIRDRYKTILAAAVLAMLTSGASAWSVGSGNGNGNGNVGIGNGNFCLLYTSDAADERSSVDLGGRRIIKNKQKKKKNE